MPLLGGDFDSRGLLRAAAYGAAASWSRASAATSAGARRPTGSTRPRSTTTPGCCASATRRCRWSGSRGSTSTRARCSARSACSRSTSRPARARRAARSRCPRSPRPRSRSCARRGRGRSPRRRAGGDRSRGACRGRELPITALTAGQLGVLLPVLAALGQVAQQVGEEEQRGRVPVPPPLRDRRRAGRRSGCCVLAWLLSILGSVVAFGGFTIVREEDRILRSGAGWSPATRRRCRSAACGPCGWSRACCGGRSGCAR